MATSDEIDKEYPEHAKLHEVKGFSQKCGEFLEWLKEKYVIGEWHVHDRGCFINGGRLACEAGDGDRLYPASVTTRKLLADFFGIDEAKLEAEKLKMLENLRKGYAKADAEDGRGGED